MISNREIKGQIDELTEQNQFLTQELQQIKELLQGQSRKQSDQQSQGQDQRQAQGQDQDQDQGQDQRQGQDQGPEQDQKQAKQSKDQSQGQDGGRQQGQQANGRGSQKQQPIFDIANDFLKLKELTGSLEKKMQDYTSSQSSGGKSMTDEDVINLVLSMMNGMIDWMMDFVSNPKQSQGNESSQLH